MAAWSVVPSTGVSVHWGWSRSKEGSLSKGSLSAGISVHGEDLCPGGSLSKGVSVQGGSLSKGGLCPRVSVKGISVLVESLS